jgi:CRISPR-associated endoribonuclease Cas6
VLTAIVLGLQPVAEGRLPLSHGALAHAAALDLFLRVDAALSRFLHDESPQKPLTISPLGGPFERQGPELLLSPEATYEWRITGLAAAVSDRLLALSPAAGGIRIGEAVFTMATAATRAEEHPDAGQESYEALQARWKEAPAGETFRLHFVSPTTFRVGLYEQPFPLPRWVFGSLLRTWNALAPERLDVPEELIESLVVLSNWRGETRRVELGGRRTVGFLGSFTYRVLDPSPDLRRLIGMLTEYAFYAGVGWQTTHGLGQARSEVGQPTRGPSAPATPR